MENSNFNIFKMEMPKNQWIWEHKDYPNFKFDENNFTEKIKNVEIIENQLNNLIYQLKNDNLVNFSTEILTDEIIHTSKIEGEFLQRNSVRSSVRKKIDSDFNEFNDKHATKQTDNLVAIFLDATNNKTPLTLERLFGWHNALFENDYDGITKIKIAQFRESLS